MIYLQQTAGSDGGIHGILHVFMDKCVPSCRRRSRHIGEKRNSCFPFPLMPKACSHGRNRARMDGALLENHCLAVLLLSSKQRFRDYGSFKNVFSAESSSARSTTRCFPPAVQVYNVSAQSLSRTSSTSCGLNISISCTRYAYCAPVTSVKKMVSPLSSKCILPKWPS